MEIDKFDQKTKPPIHDVIPKNIPKEIRKYKQWVCWFWFWDGKKWTKPPCDIHGSKLDHRKASYSFKQVLKAHKASDGKLGIGFSLRAEDPFCGGDLDNVLGPNRVKIKGLKKMIKSFPGYVETSPSGTGLRLIGFGTPATRGAKKNCVIEIYTKGRYLTFTGQANGKAGVPLTNVTKALDWLGQELGNEISSSVVTGNPGPVLGAGREGLLANADQQPVLSTNFKKMLEVIPADDYQHEWLAVGMALNHEFNGSDEGFTLWNEWSSKSKSYSGSEDCFKKWQSFGSYSGPRATGGKIHHLFKENGGVLEYVDPNIVPLKPRTFANQKPIPLEILPKRLRESAQEAARYIKTDEGLIITSMLSQFSACLGKSIRAVERGSIKHQASVGFVQGLVTGGRKSGIDKVITRPFVKYEQRLIKKWEASRPEAEAKIKSAQDQITKVRRDIKTKDLDSVALVEAEKKITELEKKIVKLDRPKPRFITADATEEQLANLMDQNNETMFCCTDEGMNIIANILGRYSSKGRGLAQNMSLYICGLLGSPFRRDRVGTGGRGKYVENDLQKPCINMSVKVQKEPLIDLVSDERFLTSGLAARLFLSIYEVHISNQYRIKGEKDLNVEKLKPYDTLVEQLMAGCVARQEGWNVHFKLDMEAREAYEDFSEAYADLLDSGKWKGYEDVTNKIVSRSVLMAAQLKVLWEPEEFLIKCDEARAGWKAAKKGSEDGAGVPVQETYMMVDKKTYEMACQVVMILMEQTLLVIGYAQEDFEMRHCERIVNNVIKGMVEDGKFGGAGGKFPGSVISQHLPGSLKPRWQEFLGMILGHGHFVEDEGKYRLNKALIGGG